VGKKYGLVEKKEIIIFNIYLQSEKFSAIAIGQQQ
jgi:hypothetical protein